MRSKRKKTVLQKQSKNLKKKKSRLLKCSKKIKNFLDQVQAKKGDKLDETYIKMKDAAAAAIVEKLPIHEGAAIMFGLPAKKVSQIMAKMNPQVASEITQQLKKGPPFVENNQTKE